MHQRRVELIVREIRVVGFLTFLPGLDKGHRAHDDVQRALLLARGHRMWSLFAGA